MAVHCLILCGGAGSRLWPSSRVRFPKPFIPLFPGGTLYEMSLKRAAALDPASIVVVTSGHLAHLCETFTDPGLKVTIKSEPFGRNTLPATILGCNHLDPDDVVILMPSDHAIEDLAALKDCLGRAVKLAWQGKIVTLGIEPGFPATGYGYIEAGKPLPEGFEVTCFVEKPPLDKAREMLANKGYYWNSGIYVFQVQSLRNEVQRQVPQMAKLFQLSSDQMEQEYEHLPALSIDHGIAEHALEMAMVPAWFDWDDLGSWRAVWNKARKGPSEIAVSPGTRLLPLESRRLLVHSDHPGEKIYVTVGVHDLAVIDTGDALVVAQLDQSDGLRKAWDQARILNPEVVDRPCTKSGDWGRAEQLSHSDAARVMRLVLNPDGRFKMRKETEGLLQVILVQGQILIDCNGEEIMPICTLPHMLPNSDMTFFNQEEEVAEVVLILIPQEPEDGAND